jgi:hypothetical protein
MPHFKRLEAGREVKSQCRNQLGNTVACTGMLEVKRKDRREESSWIQGIF